MRPRPIITLVILAINTIVFIAWNLPGSVSPLLMENNFLVSWESLADGRVWTALGSVFSHATTLHFMVNMFVLWNFGGLLERVLGRRVFLSFYLVAGIFSSICHAVVSNLLLHQPDLPALGASGALSGMVLVFSLLFPKEKLLLFGFIPIPALFGALAFIALDIWGLTAQVGGGGFPIGHGAHLGGALAGFIFYIIYLRPRMIRAAARPPGESF